MEPRTIWHARGSPTQWVANKMNHRMCGSFHGATLALHSISRGSGTRHRRPSALGRSSAEKWDQSLRHKGREVLHHSLSHFTHLKFAAFQNVVYASPFLPVRAPRSAAADRSGKKARRRVLFCSLRHEHSVGCDLLFPSGRVVCLRPGRSFHEERTKANTSSGGLFEGEEGFFGRLLSRLV